MRGSWVLLVTTLFGSASLQYIQSEGSAPLNPVDQYPQQSFTNQWPVQDFDGFPSPDSEDHMQFYKRDDEEQRDVIRKRRSADGARWEPNLSDQDKTYYSVDAVATNQLIENNKNILPVATLVPLRKRNFSPWGGKKDGMEPKWTWKRTAHVREPNMPKRVRFSPWGGKRSGHIMYKSSNKGSKIIFSTTMPELTRIVSLPTGERFIAGIQIIPTYSKRHPIEILAVSQMEGNLREHLPFATFIENLPKIFKSGKHMYSDVNLKKDGKRKLKFSAWGGKRAPPIIGPMWSPQENSIANEINKS